ncbi:PA0069 family radical SAM protein [Azospirillum sp. ST 5-10]|uniref:PA0069 family radical SAM protein n=1 Tax=unclassified Azospirillum TaxID=2630922 RepID=UPI003F49F62B
MDEVPDRVHKGRGAVGNPDGRYERTTRTAVDDGWGSASDDDLPPLRTTLSVDTSRTILARNDSPDVPFDRSVNPYRGCEHGCIYCFARPSHAYLGLSPGLDFETRLFHKPNAPELLARELRARGYRPTTIALGANTDPYQPVERGLGLTRRVLEVLEAHRHPVGIVTKSALILRDLDLLAGMAARTLVHVCVSVTTLDRDLARRMEPRAATPGRRLDTIRRLADAGVPVAVLVSPVVPGLTDHEMEAILEAAAAAGARGANTILIRLPGELAALFEAWLREHVPDRADRVLGLIRDCRGGALYQTGFGVRMTGGGAYAAMLARRFALARRRLGLGERWGGLDTSQFRVPPAAGDQLSLL